MAKQKFDKEDYRVLMGDKPKVKVVLLSPKNVMDYSIRVSATIDQNRGGSGAAAINAARVKMYKIFFTRLAEEVDGGKVRITAQRSEIFFVMYRSAMKMKRDAWLKSIKATIKSAIAQVYADLKAELNPKAAQKPAVGASKAAPGSKEIIAALKKIGINAKVITNARTGKKTIEIAVVETATNATADTKFWGLAVFKDGTEVEGDGKSTLALLVKHFKNGNNPVVSISPYGPKDKEADWAGTDVVNAKTANALLKKLC